MNTSRKPAWNVQSGEWVMTLIDDVKYYELVLSVRRMYWTGELHGVRYQKAPMVRLEIGRVGRWLMEPGDTLLSVARRAKV